MNEQQLAAVKQVRDALDSSQGYVEASSNAKLKDGWGEQLDKAEKAIADLDQVIAQDALYKMAEDAATIGLSYNDWPKIGCVNHDCDQCSKAAQPAPVQSIGPLEGLVGYTPSPIANRLVFTTGSPEKEVMVIDKTGVRVNPDYPLDEAAQHVINALDQHIKRLLAPAPVQEPVAWAGCGECDCSFPCHEGRTACMRNVESECASPSLTSGERAEYEARIKRLGEMLTLQHESGERLAARIMELEEATPPAAPEKDGAA